MDPLVEADGPPASRIESRAIFWVSPRPSDSTVAVAGLNVAALLGDGESLRDKVGGSVANWADLAEKLGADRGQHDTVRRVAKNMQERLPELMRRGLI